MTTTAVEPKRLDATQPQAVSYCVELWRRDLNIEAATKRIRARIKPHELRAESVAVVCYGPSLNDTWEQVKNFQHVITCSGAHRFMVEKGITPTWHVEVDPRPHKTALIGPPCTGTEYLIASTCHQAVFDHLEGRDVKLWHVFANEAEAFRVLPAGEWALFGGSSVGLRALTIARFLGFTDLHVFGMDGCEGQSGKHAAAHPNQPKDFSIAEWEGVEYRTTSAMLECARQTWHELDQMPDVKATFYGEGLVQHMAKSYVPKPPIKGQAMIGVNKPELISADMRRLNAELHQSNLAYGVGGHKHKDTVLKLAESLKTKNILDYGCGKGTLAKAIPWHIAEYDPAVPGKEESPKPADLVVCSDVLEHVEKERLHFVLDDLRRCVLKVGYFVIHTGPAVKTLPNGDNAHLIQQGKGWWEKKLAKFFTVGKILQKGPELYAVVAPKVKAN